MPQNSVLLSRRTALATLAVVAVMPGRVMADSGFSGWLSGFSSKARTAGVGDAALKALRRAEYLPSVIKSDRRPAETARSLQDYIGSAASPQRIKGGQRMLSRYPTLLKKIEQKYGVPKEVIVAIWGMESSFGAVRGSASVLSTLATLAYEGRRRDLFETELMAALQILTSGDVSPSRMKGSYAGAMGHTQFMPSSYLAHAEDFNRDGARDIWSDDPTDALASTAAYLRAKGWANGQPWAIEVQLPKGFDLALTGRVYPRRLRDWGKMGVTDVAGRAVKGAGSGALILPAGPTGPVFMIFQNFHVLKTYNYADSYVIGVGHLSDRLAGGRAIQASYPKKPWGMSAKERQALQKRLNELGFQAGRPDGVIGEKGRAAIRAYEKSRGMPVTGVPSRQLLAALN
ncbi:lytic murein transglycosylase [Aliiroseovarius halocynthiae]|uniref:Lytic murein transglycosylase n=1 Tax=Aliiroseovarius halocynthiae TaxID=985055 RepID=A0A545SZQ8_9RHOB|nr:lytic murein transglycosylase [Aliiroseovarius halocynthiae]TQV70440.1 lytic murein transglycosylase [Aliiroseovarius halocynthiae]SMR81843.1 lytic murein transglycosylase [Aliiroseovarius halocynthiae]